MTYFPPLSDQFAWTLDIIRQNFEQDPAYFDHPECPYSDADLAIFRTIFWSEKPEEVDFEGLSKWEKLEHESKKLFKALTEAADNLDGRDNAEKMAYFRTATSLLDKIVGIQERTANLRQVHKFHEAVLRAMEDVLDGDQRQQVMEQLKQAAAGE